jgi:L-asparagine oxygenase
MVDESYLGHRPGVLGLPRCVISGDAGRETMVFDGDLMHGLDEEAAWALDELRAAIRACQTGVVLEAGDLLVVDNTIAVHGRSPFKPRFDGTDRWLQRTFVLADVAEVPLAGRVVDVHFVG